MSKQKRLKEQGVSKEMIKKLASLTKNKSSVVMVNVKKAK